MTLWIDVQYLEPDLYPDGLSRPHPHDAGVDLRTAVPIDRPVTLWPGDETWISTGLAVSIPPGYAGLVLARSGLGGQHGIVPGNLVGVVDSGYTGPLMYRAWHRRTEGQPHSILRGDRIGQLVIVPIPAVQFRTVEALPGTARGDGGFGSSGR